MICNLTLNMKTNVRYRKAANIPSLPRILCVDDDKDTCNLIDFMFEHEDRSYVITSVRSAEEALDLIAVQSFDLYIIDCWLTAMTGFELCSRIRRTDKQTPIVFFTAMARPADRQVGMAAGANEYLIKPDDLPILTETVNRLLKAKELKPTNLQSSFQYKDSLW